MSDSQRGEGGTVEEEQQQQQQQQKIHKRKLPQSRSNREEKVGRGGVKEG